jgi:hypothetical protein
MSELIGSVFLTSGLVFMLLVGFIKFRNDCGNVGCIEKYIVVVTLLFSLVVTVVSVFTLIWI